MKPAVPRSLLVTGGGGFVGSHVVERYANAGARVRALDNLSRGKTLAGASKDPAVLEHNWRFIAGLKGVERLQADVRDAAVVDSASKGVDAIIHTAGQVAVTSAVEDPRTDFEVNALGTLNVLEAARRNDVGAVVFASTNKVYGENVNAIALKSDKSRYFFAAPEFRNGVPESLSVDHCEHTPYGVSKLAADLYCQDYGRLYGIRTGVFRMSCIYGTRQFGNEDQGWVAHFLLKTLAGEPLTIYGDGKQVRDVLFVTDLVDAYDAFLNSKVPHGVWNVGGGAGNTTSLLELLDLMQQVIGKKSKVSFSDWRPSDQKVYISDISKVRKELGWSPKVTLKTGVERFVDWHRTLAAAQPVAAARLRRSA